MYVGEAPTSSDASGKEIPAPSHLTPTQDRQEQTAAKVNSSSGVENSIQILALSLLPTFRYYTLYKVGAIYTTAFPPPFVQSSCFSFSQLPITSLLSPRPDHPACHPPKSLKFSYSEP